MKATTNNSDKKYIAIIIACIVITVATTITIGINYWGFDTFMRIMG